MRLQPEGCFSGGGRNGPAKTRRLDHGIDLAPRSTERLIHGSQESAAAFRGNNTGPICLTATVLRDHPSQSSLAFWLVLGVQRRLRGLVTTQHTGFKRENVATMLRCLRTGATALKALRHPGVEPALLCGVNFAELGGDEVRRRYRDPWLSAEQMLLGMWNVLRLWRPDPGCGALICVAINLQERCGASEGPSTSYKRAAGDGAVFYTPMHLGARGLHTSPVLSRKRFNAHLDSGTSSDASSDDDFSDDDEEDDVWDQFREVDESDDSDDDDADPAIDPKRRAAAQLDIDDDEEGTPPEGDSAATSSSVGMPGRAVYEAELETYAQKVVELRAEVRSKEFKRKPKKARDKFILEQAMQLPPPGLDAPEVVESSAKQLETLLSTRKWVTTFVDVKMTTKQTPQGKKTQYSAMVMVGDLNGTGGYGIGVSKDTAEATLKALRIAIMNSIVIPRYRQRTVCYPVHTKFIKTKMSILPRPLEFGLVGAPVLVEACELLGLHDLTVKTHGSRNTRNVIKCFFQALANIPTPQEVAEARGIYVREKFGRRSRAERTTPLPDA